jgi:hypothetical protein
MFGKNKGRQKHLAYFELREAFEQEGCCICHLLVKRSMAALQSLLYEQVTDPTSRERLQKTQGLCNWHAWMLPRIPTSQCGTAIIYEALLKDQIGALQAQRRVLLPRTFWQRLKNLCRDAARFSWLTHSYPVSSCPLCCSLKLTDETNYLRTLLDFLTEGAFSRDFEASFGLCVPHIAWTVEHLRDHANLGIFLDREVEKLEALRGELREFIRKFDYRFAAEPMGDEGTSWRRVIEIFVGKPAVFRHERPGRHGR